MSEIVYLFIVVPDDDSYFIFFPDCDGCMTQVDRIEDIVPMAADALELWLEACTENDTPLPGHEFNGEEVISELWWKDGCK